MNLNYLARGSATLACAILLTSVVSPAQAVTQTSPSSFTTPMNPPEQSDSSGNISLTESDKIDKEIIKVNQEVEKSLTASRLANNSYSDSLTVLEDRKTETGNAKSKASQANEEHNKAKKSAGKLAANLYKNGGIDLDVQTFLTTDNVDEAIYRTATMQKISESTAVTLENAKNAENISLSLTNQADEAVTAADDAAKNAANLRNQAKIANEDQKKALERSQAKKDELLKTLANLRNTTVEIESARADSIINQSQEDQLEEAIRNSSNIPEPQIPANQIQESVEQNPGQPSAPVNPWPGVNAPQPNTAPSETTQTSNSYTQVMVNFALAQTGKPYSWGGNGPNAYDCSGLVQQAFAASGKSVPRTGTAQFWAAPKRVPLSEAQYGDLLVFDHDGSGNFGHIAIYVGNGKAVQALYYGFPTGTYSIASMTNTIYPYVARY